MTEIYDFTEELKKHNRKLAEQNRKLREENAELLEIKKHKDDIVKYYLVSLDEKGKIIEEHCSSNLTDMNKVNIADSLIFEVTGEAVFD